MEIPMEILVINRLDQIVTIYLPTPDFPLPEGTEIKVESSRGWKESFVTGGKYLWRSDLYHMIKVRILNNTPRRETWDDELDRAALDLFIRYRGRRDPARPRPPPEWRPGMSGTWSTSYWTAVTPVINRYCGLFYDK